jgi:hypothetical protein
MSDKKFHFNMFDYANRAQPEFVEIADAHRPYVKMGEDNMYPHYLEALYTGSAIHSAVVKGVADMIYGHGLGSPEEDKHVDQYLNLQALFSDKTCLRRLCFDYKLYGQGYLNVIYSADRSKIAEVHHLPSANLRAGQVNDDGEVEVYYYSDNWAEVTQGRKEPQPIPAFDTQDRTAASQVLHIKQYSPISHYYGVTERLASSTWLTSATD